MWRARNQTWSVASSLFMARPLRRSAALPSADSGVLRSNMPCTKPWLPIVVSIWSKRSACGRLLTMFTSPPGSTSPYISEAGPLSTSTCS